MKQHITVEQIHQIEYEKVARAFMFDRADRFIREWRSSRNKIRYEAVVADVISIGKMIEFISKHLKKNGALRIACEEVIDVDYPGKMMWFVSIVEYVEAEEDLHEHCIQFQEDELCDALWRVAKFVLKEEEACQIKEKDTAANA